MMNSDQILNQQAHITRTKNSKRLNPSHTKPTPQPTITVETDPTVAARQLNVSTRPTDKGQITTLPLTKEIQTDITIDDKTTTQYAQIDTRGLEQNTLQHPLTMSTPEQPSGSGPNRRRTQRYKRGRHQTQLGSLSRLKKSQLLHRKGKTYGAGN